MEEIAIHSETIHLDQLLKWAGLIDNGGQIKLMLADNLIMVNKQLVSERRKKIHPGDIVEIKGSITFLVTSEIR
jgi:ribosome-associated protein